MNISFVKINGINNKDKWRFIYDAGAEDGSLGSPIVLAKEGKIIELHKGTLSLKEEANNNRI